MPEQQLERGELYKGPAGLLKASNWLTAESLPTDRDTLVQIEAVVKRKTVEFVRGGAKEKKNNYGSLRFAGKERELGLCATNIRVLCALFGSDTTRWYDQWIALYVDPAVSAFGQIVSAVRIRARKVEAPKNNQKATLTQEDAE